MNTVDRLILHLSLISGVGPATIRTLLDQKQQQILDIYNYSVADMVALGIGPAVSAKIVQGLADSSLVERELELAHKNGVAICSVTSDAYPDILKEIYLPPSVLYVKGNLDAIKSSLAIVGSRQATAYGQRAVAHLVPQLVDAGWAIISGGALGIDSYAHTAALKHGGKTVAVLGSGLLKPYPYAHKRLFEEIVASGGALVSSFALQTDPQPGNFPARNRIIAGLSRGCLVIQAGAKGGALITAKFALEQGREVFAVPGSIWEPLSEGCHDLIAQGAMLVRGAEDILSSFGYEQKKASSLPKSVQPESIEGGHRVLSEMEAKALRGCIRPVVIDELAELVGVSLVEIQSLLFDLQLEGLVSQQMTGLWQAQKILD